MCNAEGLRLYADKEVHAFDDRHESDSPKLRTGSATRNRSETSSEVDRNSTHACSNKEMHETLTIYEWNDRVTNGTHGKLTRRSQCMHTDAIHMGK